MTGDICSVRQVDWLSEFRVGLWRVTIGYIGVCGVDDLAAVWRKRTATFNLADSGRKSGRKCLNLADYVRRFVRKWLEERRGKGEERSGLCSPPRRLRIPSLWSLLSALWASGPSLLAGVLPRLRG